MRENTNYWLVGANWSGSDKKETFYLKGVWEMGYADEDKPRYTKLRDSISVDDRIAIKAMGGKGSKTITIHAIGIVKLVEEKKVYINWIQTEINKKVESKGKFSTIHKLDNNQKEWINEIFCL